MIRAVILSLIFPLFSFSQEIFIDGVVVDDENDPLIGVNIFVQNMSTGTLTDLDGKFELRVNRGSVLVFSYLGMISSEFTANRDTTLKVTLLRDVQTLDEVVIVFEKPEVEVDKGKITYNVADNSTNAGSSGFDLLKRIPGIVVDQSDNILFRGSNGVNVLIDGKMSYLSGSQLAIFLRGLSADDVEKIELVSNPSAAFDAEGNSGLINIVTKKQRAKGYALTLRSNVAKSKNFWRNNQNVSGSINSGKWRGFATLDYNTPHQYSEGESGNHIVENGEEISLVRKNTVPYNIYFYTWKVGGEWDISPQHQIGLGYHGYLDDFSGNKSSNVEKTRLDNSLHSRVISTYELDEPYHYDGLNIDYKYDIDTLGKILTADARYISYRNFSEGLLVGDHYDVRDELFLTNTLKIHQPGFIKIKSVQADVDLPYRGIDIKSGLKYAEASNDNNFSSEEKTENGFVIIPDRTNHFTYQEEIGAAYASLSKLLGRAEVELGLRYEYTRAKALLIDGSLDKEWEYSQFFPNLSLSYPWRDKHKINFAISRRINRPKYSSLNPVRWYSDEFFYYSGNPDLIPEIGWNFSTSYSLLNKYIFTAEYRKRSDYISQQLSFDENGVTVRSQSANFDNFDQFDFNLIAPFSAFGFWDLQFFTGLNYTEYPISEHSVEKRLKNWALSLSLQQQLEIMDHYEVDITMRYIPSGLYGVYLTDDVFYTDIGIRRSFFEDKLDVMFSVSDVFNGYYFQGKSQSSITDYHYYNKPDSRRLSLTVQYYLGGELLKAKSSRTDEERRL
ncbi:outer membrane beta-barrel family protein [Membranihabitans marinus]|uniref:outer membrane beta-barrel family protein n=1 Tax=Membranihabitans marinus TaxID=1227546 RepID=UPI001F381308|nr:outer membrane beta-barrel family protein [Membranihabitans marinus]